MRKLMLWITVATLTTQTLFASCMDDWLELNCCPRDDWPSSINLELGVGFRSDKFHWSIAAPTGQPNILSLLKWKDLRMVEVQGEATYVSCRNYAVRINGDYAKIYHGYNSDSDFLSDHKQDIFSYSQAKAGRGHCYDFTTGAGYRVMSTCGRFTATPLAGYSWFGQFLHIYDGVQRIDLFNNDLGRIDGLNSRYKARWYGPWVGMDFCTKVECCAYVFGTFEWHWVEYRGEGFWNLRRDIGPFRQKANGIGYVAVLGGNWEIFKDFSIGLRGTYRNFQTRHGHEAVAFHVGEETFRLRTRFNRAKWQSASALGTIGWRF